MMGKNTENWLNTSISQLTIHSSTAAPCTNDPSTLFQN